MDVEVPTSDVAGSDLNPLAVGVGIQHAMAAQYASDVMSQSTRGRGRYSTSSKVCNARLISLNPLALGAGIQPVY